MPLKSLRVYGATGESLRLGVLEFVGFGGSLVCQTDLQLHMLVDYKCHRPGPGILTYMGPPLAGILTYMGPPGPGILTYMGPPWAGILTYMGPPGPGILTYMGPPWAGILIYMGPPWAWATLGHPGPRILTYMGPPWSLGPRFFDFLVPKNIRTY